jgi:hypothetical protein
MYMPSDGFGGSFSGAFRGLFGSFKLRYMHYYIIVFMLLCIFAGLVYGVMCLIYNDLYACWHRIFATIVLVALLFAWLFGSLKIVNEVPYNAFDDILEGINNYDDCGAQQSPTPTLDADDSEALQSPTPTLDADDSEALQSPTPTLDTDDSGAPQSPTPTLDADEQSEDIYVKLSSLMPPNASDEPIVLKPDGKPISKNHLKDYMAKNFSRIKHKGTNYALLKDLTDAGYTVGKTQYYYLSNGAVIYPKIS